MSKKFLPLYTSAKIIKIDRDFPKLWSQMYCHLFYGSHCRTIEYVAYRNSTDYGPAMCIGRVVMFRVVSAGVT